MNIKHLNQTYTVLEARTLSGVTYGKLNISTSDKPAYIWRPLPPVDCIVWRPAWEVNPYAIQVWKPIITLTPDMAASVNHAIGVEVRIAA